jgi:hypothetical protein
MRHRRLFSLNYQSVMSTCYNSGTYLLQSSTGKINSLGGKMCDFLCVVLIMSNVQYLMSERKRK